MPIKSIRDEDLEIFPQSVTQLAKLAQLGFPVEEGIAVTPPSFEIIEILKLLSVSDSGSFESNKNKIKQKVLDIKIPVELTRALKGRKVNEGKIWKEIKEIWLSQLESKVLREGFDFKMLGIWGQTIFFAKDVQASGRVYAELKTKEVLVKMDQGKLEFEEGVILDSLVVEAQKKLRIPFIFSFILDKGEIKFVKLSPFTVIDVLRDGGGVEDQLGKKDITPYLKIRAIKIYVENLEGFSTAEDVDGFLVTSEKDKDLEHNMYRFAETSASHAMQPVLYQFSKANLKTDSEIFLFARNKKRLFNTQVVLENPDSLEDLLEMKRDLASFGIFRKGTLKFWLRISTPKSLLSLSDYLSSEIDGVILDLDKTFSLLSGKENLGNPDLKEREMLLKFLEEPVKILHKSHIPFLCSGSVVVEDDILHFLIKLGIYGVIFKNFNLDVHKANLKNKEASHPNLLLD